MRLKDQGKWDLWRRYVAGWIWKWAQTLDADLCVLGYPPQGRFSTITSAGWPSVCPFVLPPQCGYSGPTSRVTMVAGMKAMPGSNSMTPHYQNRSSYFSYWMPYMFAAETRQLLGIKWLHWTSSTMERAAVCPTGIYFYSKCWFAVSTIISTTIQDTQKDWSSDRCPTKHFLQTRGLFYGKWSMTMCTQPWNPLDWPCIVLPRNDQQKMEWPVRAWAGAAAWAQHLSGSGHWPSGCRTYTEWQCCVPITGIWGSQIHGGGRIIPPRHYSQAVTCRIWSSHPWKQTLLGSISRFLEGNFQLGKTINSH